MFHWEASEITSEMAWPYDQEQSLGIDVDSNHSNNNSIINNNNLFQNIPKVNGINLNLIFEVNITWIPGRKIKLKKKNKHKAKWLVIKVAKILNKILASQM